MKGMKSMMRVLILHYFLIVIQYILKKFHNGVASFGFNYGGNFVVKRAQVGVVLGWVTSWEVPVLHPCENHLDPMSAKCSIYAHARWIHVESLLMKHGSMSLTQITKLNPDSNITAMMITAKIY